MLRNLSLTLVLVLAGLATACGPTRFAAEPAVSNVETAAEHMADHHTAGMHMDGDQHYMQGGHADEHMNGTPHNSGGPIEGAREIHIIAKEFSFEPATIYLIKGEAVNIVLDNQGVLPHELGIKALGFHAHTEAGESVTVGLVATQNGRFEIGCYIPGHFENGMKGELQVEEAAG